MRLTITGLLKGKNKDGRNFTVIHGTTPFSQYETNNNDVVGSKATNVYTSLDCDILTVGDVIDLNYEPGFQGQATLVGYDMVAPFKDKPASPDAVKK
jgi:hypothetical protein